LELAEWSNHYDILLHLWGNYNDAYISKDDVHLYDWGGNVTVEELLANLLAYLRRVNPKLHAEIISIF